MKFCYIDESGCGSESVLVMAGIVTDAARMHVTKENWKFILNGLSKILQKPVAEFHTRHFYRGNGIWHDLTGRQRTRLMDIIIEWLKDRRHSVVFVAIDKKKASKLDWKDKPDYLINKKKPNHWRLAALHLMLCIQKEYQRCEKTKGHTVLIFDHESGEESQLAEIVLNPPQWSDSYYGYNRDLRRKDNPAPLSHIIDVPYFADSKHVGMLQVADLFAYLLRHYAELHAGYAKEKYSNETNLIAKWVKQIAQFMLPDSNRWPALGACKCAKFFRSMAPEPLIKIHTESKS